MSFFFAQSSTRTNPFVVSIPIQVICVLLSIPDMNDSSLLDELLIICALFFLVFFFLLLGINEIYLIQLRDVDQWISVCFVIRMQHVRPPDVERVSSKRWEINYVPRRLLKVLFFVKLTEHVLSNGFDSVDGNRFFGMLFETTNLLLTKMIPIHHQWQQRASQTELRQEPSELYPFEYLISMLVLVSYFNLAILLAISIGHLVLAALYHDQCPASTFLSTTLMITGLSGIFLSLVALFIHHHTSADASNRWNLTITYILFVYLIASRIATSTIAFRLAGRNRDKSRCALILYWGSTILILVSYATIITMFYLLFDLIMSQNRQKKKPGLSNLPPILLT